MRYIASIATLLLTTLSQTGLAGDGDYFQDSSIQLPYRDAEIPVKKIMGKNMRVADLLGITPLPANTVSVEKLAVAQMETPEASKAKLQSLIDSSDIQLKKPNDIVDLKAWLSSASQIFIRDESVAVWDQGESVVQATGYGQTELYVVENGEMTIVNIRVGDADDLVIDQALTASQNISVAVSDGQFARLSQPYKSKKIAPSVRDAADLAMELQDRGKIVLPKSNNDLVFKKVAIQLTDHFDFPSLRNTEDYEQPNVFPNVEVSLVGSDFVSVTDSSGTVEIADIPAEVVFSSRSMINLGA